MAENVQRVILTADDKTRAAFASFRANIKGANESTNSLNKASVLLKRGLGAIGVGFSAVSIITGASDLEKALVGVSKTTGLAGQELEDFSERISQVSTRIPVTTGELLELAQAAGQMGVTGAANLEKFSVTVAKLGRASDLSGEQAAKSLARILNVTGESVDSVDTLASVIVSLGNNVAASESEIAKMTNEVARSTAAFGVNSAEAAAMSAAMASVGIQAQLGGSSVGRAMQEITSRVQAGGKDLRQFAEALDLNADTLTDLFAENKTAAFEFFLQQVGELGLDAGNALKSVGLGGAEIANTIIPLANNMEIFAKTLKLANDEVREATALDREFDATLKTLDTQWQISKNIVVSYAQSIGGVLVPALNAGLIALNNFFGAGQEDDVIQNQVNLIEELDSKIQSLKSRNTGLDGVISGASKVFGTNKREIDELEVSLENYIQDLFGMIEGQAKLTDESKKLDEAIKPVKDSVDDLSGSSDKASKNAKQFIDQLIKESGQAGLTATEIRKLEAATLGVSKVADPLIDHIDQTNKELAEQQKIAALLEDDLRKIESITQSVRTEEEKFADEVRELDRLLEAGLGPQAHARQLQNLEEQLLGISGTTAKVTDDFSRFWDQAVRNVQSTLADGIFNFFDNGLKGMLRNAISTAGRIASEFAALTLAQGAGLGTLFASGSAASAGGAASASNALSLANIGSSISSGFSGIRSLLTGSGSVFSAGSGGAGSAFIGGQGTAIGGTGFGASAGAGLTFASGGLVLGAALLTKGFNDLIANDNKIAGVTGSTLNKFINPLSQIPVIGKFLPDFGGILTGIFGRAPFKFRQQFAGGTATSEGFQNGFVTDVFRSKGGLLRGNKHKQQDAANADEILSLFDDSIKAFFGSTRALAENLNLDAQALDNLTLNVAIQSKKKKAISQEQIAAEMARLSDSIAQSVLPNISELTRGGETYANTLSRLSGEMTTLTNAANVFGLSLEDSSNLINGFSLEARTALVDSLGGIDAVAQKTQFFANNFLTDAEKLDLASQSVNKALSEFGETADSLSRDEFGELLKSFIFLGEEGAESANKLFGVAGSFLAVKDAARQLEQTAIGTAQSVIDAAQALKDSQLIGINDSFSALQQSVDTERNKLTNEYNASIKQVNDSVGTLTSLSNALKSTTQTINPLSQDQARNNLRGAIAQSRSGNVVDLNNVSSSLAALTKSDTRAFRTRLDLERSQAESTSLLSELESLTDNQLKAEEQSLEILKIGFDTEIGRLDSMIINAQLQLDVLNGIDSKLLNLGVNDALGNFNTQSVAAGGNAVVGAGGSLPFNGNRNITGLQIQDFLAVNDDPFTIYNAARDNNVTGQQLAANSRFTIDQINQFADENNLPRLAIGTNFIPRDMPAFLHQGEQVKPKAFVDSEKAERKELIGLMKKVLIATEISTVGNNKVKKTLEKWEKVGMPKERAA